jgi:predicted  nucleic acid-binding Zn-ribbon protein
MSNECQLIFDAEYKLALAAIVAARPIPAPKVDVGNQMQIIVSGPDADGITNVGICFTNPSELSGSVIYNIDNVGSGGFLKHSGTPACPSYASGSSGFRLTPGTTYNYSATASNNGKSFSASTSYTAPAVDPAIEAARLARVAADDDFRSRQNTARATAEAQSLAWNTANPGQQKCFQWGPIVHSNGVSTASGGACANPVGTVPTAGATETITATTTASPTRVETQTSTTTASPTRVETQTSTTTDSPARSDTTTATTIFTPAPTPTAGSMETITSTSTSTPTPSTPAIARPASSPEIVESDGSEEEPAATLAVTKKSNGKYQIKINSNVAEEQFIITATKKGSKTVTYKATTNDSGDVIVQTTRNLSGFTLTLRLNGEYMDKEKVK